MRITDRTADMLTLTDTQADKAVAIYGLSVVLVGFAVAMAWQGDWGLVAPPLVIVAVALGYLKLSRMTTVLHFDRQADKITLDLMKRGGAEHWEWKFSDLETARLSTRGEHGTDSGIHRPVMVLKDGTEAPMRPYHAAGSQSWHAVAAVKLFLGQSIADDAPTGWIPPQEFDSFFSEEMKRLYKPD
ncbi:hypothetical protein [Aestuariivita boseongensis]|uniref:hypothetical protein n=1 Tax=Aestuariivita boseongensis TaxID=1470562 RepID=UPI0006800FE5|nr:hypothetical protein [Aestuariivita boseongensis]